MENRNKITPKKILLSILREFNRSGANDVIQENAHVHNVSLSKNLLGKGVVIDPEKLAILADKLDGEEFDDLKLN